eukprot:CAMPEP_0118987086 /NCGR_PEP_ID=MMETSP1173-20130426/43464_1 /TAXON_ID=1034831 /ORGANISM="Rhizochromulina marina cf, Strain CCMP1243" /LENGTH=45 /DNA_ID= /DNA_START= /DNA_END= /DNA_ORIENTATION=
MIGDSHVVNSTSSSSPGISRHQVCAAPEPKPSSGTARTRDGPAPP